VGILRLRFIFVASNHGKLAPNRSNFPLRSKCDLACPLRHVRSAPKTRTNVNGGFARQKRLLANRNNGKLAIHPNNREVDGFEHRFRTFRKPCLRTEELDYAATFDRKRSTDARRSAA
jgi:hypothetical protein